MSDVVTDRHTHRTTSGACAPRVNYIISLDFVHPSITSNLYNSQEHIQQVVNEQVLTMLNNTNFNLCSIKVRSLLSTMALFTPTNISLPTMVIDVKTTLTIIFNFMILMIKRLQSYSFNRMSSTHRLAPLMLCFCLVI